MIAAVWSGLWWPLAALAVLAVALPRGRGWCLLLALSWAHGLLALEQGLDRRLPEYLNGTPLTVEARVVGLPVTDTRRRFGETLRRQRIILDLRLAVDDLVDMHGFLEIQPEVEELGAKRGLRPVGP